MTTPETSLEGARSRAPAALIPPSIADAPRRAFGAIMTRALAEPDFMRLLFERVDDVDAALLPFLIREFSIEDLVAPGMSEAVVRRLLKSSYQMHARTGFIDGVRLGLALLGARVLSWEQWFQATPPRAPGTHRVVLALEDAAFEAEGRAYTARLHRALARMVDGTKRWSQDVTLSLGATCGTPAFVGALCRIRIRIVPAGEAVTQLAGVAPVVAGAVVATRIRIRPGA